MATHSSILAWRIPWTTWNLMGYSPWGCKESVTTQQLSTHSRISDVKIIFKLVGLNCFHSFQVCVVPDVRIPEQEERRPPRQCNWQKRGSLLLTRARALCRNQRSGAGQRAPSPSCYTNLQGKHTPPFVVGLSRLVTSLQSNFIGRNFQAGRTFLGVSALFLIS